MSMIYFYTAPSTGLYFTLNGTIYRSGDSVPLVDIGGTSDCSRPGKSLVCETRNVNLRCCRRRDGGAVGEWRFPNGTMVPRSGSAPTADYTWCSHTRKVQLSHWSKSMAPTGFYECRVPDIYGRTYTARIQLTAEGMNV